MLSVKHYRIVRINSLLEIESGHTLSDVVRSNSEPANLLHLAEQFREVDKFFDVSLAEIDRQLGRQGEAEYRADSEVYDENGSRVGAEVRLNINCESPRRTGWSVSVKLHQIRIDCIDWEGWFNIAPGKRGVGWHRHTWDRNAGDAENSGFGKQPVIGLDDETISRSEFLTRVFKEMRVLLNSIDHGNDQLPFD